LAPEHGHGREILDRIVGQAGAETHRDRVRARGGKADGVAVRRRLGDRIGADIAAGARAVLDDNLLPEALAELLPHDARDDVGAGAGKGTIKRIGCCGQPTSIGWAVVAEPKTITVISTIEASRIILVISVAPQQARPLVPAMLRCRCGQVKAEPSRAAVGEVPSLVRSALPDGSHRRPLRRPVL